MGKKKEKFKMKEGGYNMCTAFQEMVEEGRIVGYGQGVEQGKNIGRMLSKIELVCKKLKKGKVPEDLRG